MLVMLDSAPLFITKPLIVLPLVPACILPPTLRSWIFERGLSAEALLESEATFEDPLFAAFESACCLYTKYDPTPITRSKTAIMGKVSMLPLLEVLILVALVELVGFFLSLLASLILFVLLNTAVLLVWLMLSLSRVVESVLLTVFFTEILTGTLLLSLCISIESYLVVAGVSINESEDEV